MASRSCKNNNPGNIRFGPFAEKRGAINSDGYAKWATPIQGLAAMVDLLAGESYRGLMLVEAINRYAPRADHNQPQEYVGYICQRAAVSPGIVMGQMDPFQILRVVEAMIRFEGWKG